MLNLRFEFEQPQSKLQVPSRPKSTRSEDRDSAWVTDDESDTEGGVALRCSKETWKMTHERQLMSRRPFRNWWTRGYGMQEMNKWFNEVAWLSW